MHTSSRWKLLHQKGQESQLLTRNSKFPPSVAVRLEGITDEWPIFALHRSHGGCPILAFFARARELAKGAGGDAAAATLVRSTPPPCVCHRPTRPSQSTRRTGHPLPWWLLQFESRARPPTLRFPAPTRVALRSDLG